MSSVCWWVQHRGGGSTNHSTSSFSSHPSNNTNATAAAPNTTTKNHYRVYLAFGSNLGNRFDNIQKALQLLTTTSTSSTTRLLQTSFCYQTAPMYVTDQPPFWNGVVLMETDLEPMDLLHRVKDIEASLGRQQSGGMRNGPRPVDLDILFYQTRRVVAAKEETETTIKDDEENKDSHHNNITWSNVIVNEKNHTEDGQCRDLIIPHPAMPERDFVLLPLLEVAGREFRHPVLNQTVGALWDELLLQQEQNQQQNDEQESPQPRPRPVRILPLPRHHQGRAALVFDKTLCMGILNVTPDSFSDGGVWTTSLDQSIAHALEMQQQGADVIDIGGESTRPGAKPVSLEQELQRTIPVIQGIRKVSNIPISIDTRRAAVAKAAIEAGADLVNDVSGGTFDPEMLSTVAQLNVPIVLMHMRGTPQTMQSMTDYNTNNNDDDNAVVHAVATFLQKQSAAAQRAGIHRWLQAVDPGIGFAKDLEGNLQLLRHLDMIRSRVHQLPVLLGTSRKGFIGKLSGVTDPADRDFGTVASCVAALCLEDNERSSSMAACNIVRVHNVQAFVQAAAVMDAIRSSSSSSSSSSTR